MKTSIKKGIIVIISFFIAGGAALFFVRFTNAEARTVYINEVCTANASAGADAQGKYRNYVELYNAGEEDADLSGMYLTNKRKRPKKFSLQGVTIPAHGYAVIWLGGSKAENASRSGRDEILEEQSQEQDVAPGTYNYTIIDDTGLHVASSNEANFDYDLDGGDLYLTSGKKSGADYVRIPKLTTNTSYSRTSDGGSSWHTSTCTPGVSNELGAEKRTIALSKPQFSRDSGFYEDAFSLTLSAGEDEEIYYTLDGSDPSPESTSSILYKGAIEITDRSGEKNEYASLTNIQIPSNYTPDEPVDKATVVKAISYNPGSGQISRIATETFFIGYQDKSAYAGLPVVSLVSDPTNLFDYYHGIYTTGVTYEQYLQIGGFGNWDPDDVPAFFYKDEQGNVYIPGLNTDEEREKTENGSEKENMPSLTGSNQRIGTASFQEGSSDDFDSYWRYEYENATQSGRSWEREATISYFDGDHQLQFTQNVGIRIAGESSRSALQKSMNVYARKAYDTKGNGKFTYPFFNNSNFDKYRLRHADTSGLSNDMMLMQLAEGRAVGVERGKPVVVFLDGEYWGIYYIREQYQKEYFEYYYDADPDDIWVLKNYHAAIGSEDHVHDYDILVQQITLMDMSDPVQYGVVERSINLDSLIDWYCLNLYADNEDTGSDRNISVWRTAEDEGSSPCDGKWNYLLYDMDETAGDHGSGVEKYSVNSSSWTTLKSLLIAGEESAEETGVPGAVNTFENYRNRDATFYLPGWLCANEDFREQYCTTMMDIANTTYSYHRVHALLKGYKEQLKEQALNSTARFTTSDPAEAERIFEEHYNHFNEFFMNRRAYIEQYLKEDQNLTGDIVPVTVSVTNPEGGSIQVNSATLNEDEEAAGWTGEYFSDFGITVRAEAADGYHFAGWELIQGDTTSKETDAEISIDLKAGSVILKAVFEK